MFNKRILGIDIIRNREVGTLWLAQKDYSLRMLKRFNMEHCKSVSFPLTSHFKLSALQCPKTDLEKEYMLNIPYANAVGSLMYLMVCTRLDLAHSLSVVSKYMSNPGKEHWHVVKWIMRNVKGTISYGLVYTIKILSEPKLVGYVDANYATDSNRRRSLSRVVFMLFENTVSWKSNLQPVVALSTTETEYMAATEGVKEAL